MWQSCKQLSLLPGHIRSSVVLVYEADNCKRNAGWRVQWRCSKDLDYHRQGGSVFNCRGLSVTRIGQKRQGWIYVKSVKRTDLGTRNNGLDVCSDLDLNQSIKIYFPSNDKELQYSKCYSTWKATREALRLLKVVARTKTTTQILIHQKKRKETGGEINISMCNLSTNTSKIHYTINSKSSIHTSWFLLHWVTNQQQFLTYSERIGMQCY